MDQETKDKLKHMAWKLPAEARVTLHNALDDLVNQYGIQQVIYHLGAVAVSNYAYILGHEKDGMEHYLDLTAQEWGMVTDLLEEADQKLIHILDAEIPF